MIIETINHNTVLYEADNRMTAVSLGMALLDALIPCTIAPGRFGCTTVLVSDENAVKAREVRDRWMALGC